MLGGCLNEVFDGRKGADLLFDMRCSGSDFRFVLLMSYLTCLLLGLLVCNDSFQTSSF